MFLSVELVTGHKPHMKVCFPLSVLRSVFLQGKMSGESAHMFVGTDMPVNVCPTCILVYGNLFHSLFDSVSTTKHPLCMHIVVFYCLLCVYMSKGFVCVCV